MMTYQLTPLRTEKPVTLLDYQHEFHENAFLMHGTVLGQFSLKTEGKGFLDQASLDAIASVQALYQKFALETNMLCAEVYTKDTLDQGYFHHDLGKLFLDYGKRVKDSSGPSLVVFFGSTEKLPLDMHSYLMSFSKHTQGRLTVSDRINSLQSGLLLDGRPCVLTTLMVEMSFPVSHDQSIEDCYFYSMTLHPLRVQAKMEVPRSIRFIENGHFNYFRLFRVPDLLWRDDTVPDSICYTTQWSTDRSGKRVSSPETVDSDLPFEIVPSMAPVLPDANQNDEHFLPNFTDSDYMWISDKHRENRPTPYVNWRGEELLEETVEMEGILA
jgi:hypothetical protein